jgi:hypothetical protein
MKRFLTIVVESILGPFAAHNTQQHTAQVMGAKNRVTSVLKHSLLKGTASSAACNKTIQCSTTPHVTGTWNRFQPALAVTCITSPLYFQRIVRVVITYIP